MAEIARRTFLVEAAAIGAAATAAGALLRGDPRPATSRLRVKAPSDVVVHVRDFDTAEISLLVGTEELVYRDERLVGSIIDALNRG
jgi:hypothetical protein